MTEDGVIHTVGAAGSPEMMREWRHIPLNLVYTYPIRWSRFKVLRDLVQNFFDAVGHVRWAREFSWRAEGTDLMLEASGVGFTHEWLLHIGASTKTSAPRGTYAGFYGEGFKMAALCAHRDHGWTITMASRDWELKVGCADLSIDGQALRSLCYQVRSREVADTTTLVIGRASADDAQALRTVVQSFYYAENPLLGELIYEDRRVAIHVRSAESKPHGFPETYDSRGPGIVFAAYQAMGSHHLPLVFAVHDARPKSRERDTFYRMDVVSLVQDAVSNLPPAAAAKVLERLRSLWYRYPTKRYDFDSWYAIVRRLARSVGECREESARFRLKYPSLLVAGRVPRSDVSANNRRREAHAWLKGSRRGRCLVQDGFAAIGYANLEQACEEAGGFSQLRSPSDAESPFLRLLGQVVAALFPSVVPHSGLPPCRVIDNHTAAWKGLANHIPAPARSRRGEVRHRRTLQFVAIDANLLHPDSFDQALGVYLHELAHAFGSDYSAAFSHSLTDLLTDAITHAADLSAFRERWEALTGPTRSTTWAPPRRPGLE